MSDEIASAVEGFVGGDLRLLVVLRGACDAALNEYAAQAGPVVVTRDAAAAMLRRLAEGDIDPLDVQAWASLARWGILPGRQHQKTIDIDFDLRFEDQIVEVVGRLDEIGDLIDGVVSPDEARELLEQLYA